MRTAGWVTLTLALGCARTAAVVEPPTRHTPVVAQIHAQAVSAADSRARTNSTIAPGEVVASDVPVLPCAAPMMRNDACRCLLQTLPPGDDTRACEIIDTGVDGFALARHGTESFGEERVLVLAQQPGGAWSVVAVLAHVFNPGAMGISEEWSLQSAGERIVGAHAVVELVGHALRNDTDMGIDEFETEERETLLVCLRSSGATPASCPLEVVRAYRYERDVMGVDESIDPELHTKGLPIRSAYELGVELRADGVAHIWSMIGTPDAGQLGERKLW